MSSTRHTIIYATPPHDPVRTVECACGWRVSRDRCEETPFGATLATLTNEWLKHALQSAAGCQSA